jgi:sugar porter (SP) family MFS transporter
MKTPVVSAPSDFGVGSGLVVRIALVAALAGLLFGYDTGIIGVALLGLGRELALDDVARQLVTGAIIFGALFGCVGTGPVSDRFGRRPTIMLVGAVFALGAILSAFSPGVEALIGSRLLLGLAAGSATQIVPVYIAEVAPPAHRGKLVVLFQFMICLGITVAYFTGFALGEAWRVMLGLGAVPATILLLGVAFLPESPRWLLISGKEDAARAMLERIRPLDQVGLEMDEIRSVSAMPQGSWRDLFQPWVRPAIVVGTGIAMFSQVTGNNALIYYAPTILTRAGFSESTAVLATGSSTVLVLMMTMIGSVLVDRVGRRRYLLWMIPGSIVALGLLAFLFSNGGAATPVGRGAMVACLAAYLMLNCGGFGVCIWLINSEVYPLFVRGKGASLGAFSHWIFDLLVTMTTLSLVSALGVSSTLLLYAAISFAAVLFIYFLVPETIGQSLEQIEHRLREGRFYPRSGAAAACGAGRTQ